MDDDVEYESPAVIMLLLMFCLIIILELRIDLDDGRFSLCEISGIVLGESLCTDYYLFVRGRFYGIFFPGVLERSTRDFPSNVASKIDCVLLSASLMSDISVSFRTNFLSRTLSRNLALRT